MSDFEHEFDERLERAKLEAMKELAYGASHEINNPLANISARAQTLLRDERDPERRRALEAIHHQALRAHEMISDLMLFARPPRLELRPVDVRPIVEQVVSELAAECRRRDIQMAASVPAEVAAISGDEAQLAIAIKAVCVNAMEAIGRSGRVEIAVESMGDDRDERDSPAGVRIVVRDDGPGIAPEHRTHIFEPFFSGREAGRGLGFGLSKAWRIVTEHGGRITVDSPAGGGATFILELPADAGVR